MQREEKLLKVFDYICQKDLKKADLIYLDEILKVYTFVDTNSPMEKIPDYIMSNGFHFIPDGYFVGSFDVSDSNQAHRPVMEYLGALPHNFVMSHTVHNPFKGASEILNELETLRKAVKIRRSEIPFEQQIEKIDKLKSKFIEKKPVDKVLEYLDFANEKDLELLKKLFSIYCSQKEERKPLSSRITVSLFETPQLAKFVPHNYTFEYEWEIEYYAKVHKMYDVGQKILSCAQKTNPITDYLSNLPANYKADITDNNDEHNYENSKTRQEIQKIQSKIEARLEENYL